MGMSVAPAVRFAFPAQFEKIVGIALRNRREAIENRHEILDEHRLVVVDDNGRRRMRTIHQHLPFSYSGIHDDIFHLTRDIDKLDLHGAFYLDFLFVNLHEIMKHATYSMKQVVICCMLYVI